MWFWNIIGWILGFLFITVLIPLILDSIFTKKEWLFIDVLRTKIIPNLCIVIVGILRFGFLFYAKKVGWF